MRRHPLLAFFVLTVLLSWGFWLPLMMAAQGQIQAPFSPRQMQVLGACGPAIAAMIVTVMTGGLDALRDLLSRLLAWRVGIRWYLAALFLPGLISLLNTTLYTMFGGDAPNFADPPVSRVPLPSFLTTLSPLGLILPLFAYYLILGTAVGEELAWRGFVLERFQQRQSSLKASLWVGFLWVIWTLPLYWAPSEPGVMLVRLVLLLLGVIPASILSTWIYNGTQGSLLLAVLFNNAAKVTDLFITPPGAGPIFTIASLWIVALVVLRLAGTKLASRPAAATQQRPNATIADSKATSSLSSGLP